MASEPIDFFVPGLPKPGGSKKAFYSKKLGRAFVVDACKGNRAWRDTVAAFAVEAYQGPPLACPLALNVVFVMPRPQAHYETCKARRGQLRADAPFHHAKRPDATKLTRSTEDALTGILWADDSLIVRQCISKIYGDRPGAYITVQPIGEANGLQVPVQQPDSGESAGQG